MVGKIVTVIEQKRYAFVRVTGMEHDVFLHEKQMLLPDDVAFGRGLKGSVVDFELEQGINGPWCKGARLVTE